MPHAILSNPSLEWRVAGDRVEVTTLVGGTPISMVFAFDAAGDVVGARGIRARAEGNATVPTPWGGEFSAYETIGGARIPTRAEVYWDLPAGRFTYFKCNVTRLELVPSLASGIR